MFFVIVLRSYAILGFSYALRFGAHLLVEK